LAQAEAKKGAATTGPNSPPTFQQGDARVVRLGRRFDAVIMMFAVLGYQTSNQDLLAALANVREHLQPGGAFIFDVWYGPAVLATRPGQRIKVLRTGDGSLIRTADGSLDIARHLCTVTYHLWRLSGERLVGETRESHQMRYFFPLELELALAHSRLELRQLSAFPSLETKPNESTWNVLGVAC